ncbi:MAG: LptF/LptG family permease [Planctomycetota bacterium]
MHILSRYVLRQFLQIFCICFLSLTGLYVVIDAFGHLDHFSSHAERDSNILAVVAQYYAYRSLSFFDRTSGILAMIAAMFTVAWLHRHQELTAMMAAGIPKARIVKPLLFATVAVSLLAAANRECVIPNVRDELSRDTKDLAGSEQRDMEARYDSNSILVGGEKIVLAERRIVNPAFILPGELSLYGKQLTAEAAFHVPATADHPVGFILSGVTAPKSLVDRPSLELNSRPVITTPRDAQWELAPDEVFVATEVPFDLLTSGSVWRAYASTGELVAELNRPSADLGDDVRVTVHARIVKPLLDCTLLMLGLPLMFSRRSRNVFLSIGVCLLAATAFSLTTLTCQAAGNVGVLSPSLAAWAPLMLFAPMAAWISHDLRN